MKLGYTEHMVFIHRITRGAFAGLCIMAMLGGFTPAKAEDESLTAVPLLPYNDIGLYHISWSGVPVGFLLIDADETTEGYHIDVRTKATGILRMATRHSSSMTTKGIKKDGKYLPQHFETTFKLRDDTRHITLDFDAKGKLTHETNEPPEPEWKRPKVESSLKEYALDPLTAFYAHRPLIHRALREKQERFTLRYYDGRRLTDLHYEVNGLTTTEVGKQKTQVLAVTVTREAIAGYRDKELKEMKGKDMKLQLFFSTDGKFLPLRFIVDAKMGAFYASYVRSCANFEDCAKRIK